MVANMFGAPRDEICQNKFLPDTALWEKRFQMMTDDPHSFPVLQFGVAADYHGSSLVPIEIEG